MNKTQSRLDNTRALLPWIFKKKKRQKSKIFQPAVVTSGSDKVSSLQDESDVGIETLLTRLPFVKFLILIFFFPDTDVSVACL